MADDKSIKHAELDPFSRAVVYRLRRDALMIVSSFNRGGQLNQAAMARQVSFVQAQLCSAAVADPRIPAASKTALVEFHAATVQESNQHRRGERWNRATVLDFEVQG